MNPDLIRAYKKIFRTEPEAGVEDWQVAEKIMNKFEIANLGEGLAKEVIYAIVLDINYPSQEITTRIVGQAEGFANELWDDLPGEVHMADLARKRYWEQVEKEKSKEPRRELSTR